MAHVIDAFMVTMGLDPSTFIDGAKDVKRAQLDINVVIQDSNRQEQRIDGEREKRVKKTVDGYKTIRREVLGLFAVFTAGRGLKNFIGDTITEAANLGYLAENLKTSTTELTAWQRASERAGGSAEGITGQLKEAADTIAQLKVGMGANDGLQWFFRAGGNKNDLKDGNTYLLARSKIVHDLFKQDPSKAALIASQMGIAEDQFDFIKQGPAAIEALIAAQRKNAVITAQDAENARKLRNEYLDLTQSLQATAVKLLVALIPAFSKFVVAVNGVTKNLTDNKDVVAEWADKIVSFDWAGLVTDAKEFAGSIREVTKDVRELIDRWDEWTGRSKVQTPGVEKLPGALRFGKTEDLNTDNKATGKPVPAAPQLQNKALQSVSDNIEMGIARTLASFGVKAAKEYVRDTTGKDDYLAGPKQPTAGGAAGKSVQAPRSTARGIRNNNPGNLVHGDFTRNHGATGVGDAGRFARFNSPQEGINAMSALLKSYHSRGIDSIEKIINRYAPPSENKTGEYAATVAKQVGVKTSDKLDLNDPAVMQKLLGAMIKHENGAQPYSADMLNMATMTRQAGRAGTGSATTQASTTTITNNIGEVVVNTRATDAAGIARDMRPELSKMTFSNQASTGVRQ